MKDLSNYFNNWYHIDWMCDQITTKDIEREIEEVVTWCKDNFGIKGGNWDLRSTAKVSEKRGSLTRFIFTFRFKNESDAMLFILRWGGDFTPLNS